jgi:hypothetical protein
MLVAWSRHDALGDLALEHQRQALEEGRPRLHCQPAGQQLRTDIVGQVGDDPRRPVRQDAIVHLHGIATDHRQPPGICFGDFRKGGQGARIALDGDDLSGALGEKRAGQPARPRTDLDHTHAFERSAHPGDAGREVQVEQEVLPQFLLGPQPVGIDDLAQRRELVDLAHGWGVSSKSVGGFAFRKRDKTNDGIISPLPRHGDVIPWPSSCLPWQWPRRSWKGRPCRCRQGRKRYHGRVRCARWGGRG